MAHTRPPRHRSPLHSAPPVVLALVGVFTAVQLAETILPLDLAQSLFSRLAFFPEIFSYLATGNSEVIVYVIPSLFTYALLHGGWIHLIVNSLVFIQLGGMVAQVLKTWRFLVLFFLCAAGGAIFDWWLTPHRGALVGASGSVFGLGAAIAILRADALLLAGFGRFSFLLRQTMGWMIANAAIYMAAKLLSEGGGGGVTVAWAAHLGGYMTGLAITPLLRGRKLTANEKGT